MGLDPDLASDLRSEPPRLIRSIELLVLSAFTFAQPLYALTGQNPTFLIAHRLEGWRLVGFAAAVLLLPAIALTILDQGLRFLARDRAPLASAILRGALLALIIGPPVNSLLGLDGTASVALLAALAAPGTLLMFRSVLSRRILLYASFAPILFPAVFLATDPVASLLSIEDPVATSDIAPSLQPVVWLVFDQLPLALMIDEEGQIIEDRFPNFARLSERSTWYSNAITVASDTALSMTTSLTGQLADHGGLPVASAYPRNIFTILGRSHEILAQENVTQLCPPSACGETEALYGLETLVTDTTYVVVRVLLADSVADRLVPEINDRWAGFGRTGLPEVARETAGEATTFEEIRRARSSGDDRVRFDAYIESMQADRGPALYYLHQEKPHEPLLFLPDGRIYDFCSCYATDSEGVWPAEEPMVRQRLQRYVMQAMDVDRLLGRALDRMDETGLSDSAMLIVMSDHGASLLPGTSNRTLTASNSNDVLPVPLFIMFPGQTEGWIDPRPAQLVDVLPTIAETLGISNTDGFDGVSLLDADGDVRPLRVITPDGPEELESVPDARQSALIGWLRELMPDPTRPFAFGPHRDLVDTPVPDPANPADGLVITGLAPRLSARADSVYAPAHVIGELVGADEPVEIAIAVDDQIVGVGTTFWSGLWRISVMIDPALVAGDLTSLAMYQVTDSGLLRIPLE